MWDITGHMPLHAKEKQNLGIWSMGRNNYFNVDYIEGLPIGSPAVVNYGAVGANASLALTELTDFDLDEHQLVQLRMFPIDPIELRVWVTRSQGKFLIRGLHARVSKMSRAFDPYMAKSEINILGRDRGAFIEAFNNNDYALGQARVMFWGWRYILVPLHNIVENVDRTGVVKPYVTDPSGNPDRDVPLICTFLNAEGRPN